MGIDGLRFLLVEQRADVRAYVAMVLASDGAEIATAESTTEALQQVESWQPSAIISDHALPRIESYERVRPLASEGQLLCNLPVRNLRTKASDGLAKDNFEEFFHVYLARPLCRDHADRVIAEIHHVLDRISLQGHFVLAS